ncbi:MAG: methionyl-tRNA formyltransferase [Alphaproteobacteria bacterium]|nr:methionyl-tRNA formyltransferase [Alphaproteobacteria bacterium]
MKLIFMGTPAFTLPVLEALSKKHELLAIYTRAPKPAGHGMKLTKSAVHEWGDAHNIPVYTPATLKEELVQKEIADMGADAIIVYAYAMMIPTAVLNCTPKGCINIHPSLLPRWRGAAPMVRTIQAGDNETGVSLMRLDEGWDTGPVFGQEKVAIAPDETPESLRDKLNPLAVDMLMNLLDNFYEPTPQSEMGACYAPKVEKTEFLIDWSLTASQIERNIRAFEKCYFILNGKRVKVLKAKVLDGTGATGTTIDDKLQVACGKGILDLEILQKEGKNSTSKHDFLLGTKVPKGTNLCAIN